jgi:hypothetical protein
MNKEIKTLRKLLGTFMVILAISGLTAIPVTQELEFLNRVIPAGTVVGDWLLHVYTGFKETDTQYPFLAYGYDWLAFAHIVLAILFYGPWKDPVRNKWVVEFGMIACVLILPWALITGHFRGIPFWWRLIDCSFGVIGFAVLNICRRKIIGLEKTMQDKTILHAIQ